MNVTESLELMASHEREIQTLRRAQLQRDGRIYDSALGKWLLADGTTQPFATQDDHESEK